MRTQTHLQLIWTVPDFEQLEVKAEKYYKSENIALGAGKWQLQLWLVRRRREDADIWLCLCNKGRKQFISWSCSVIDYDGNQGRGVGCTAGVVLGKDEIDEEVLSTRPQMLPWLENEALVRGAHLRCPTRRRASSFGHSRCSVRCVPFAR